MRCCLTQIHSGISGVLAISLCNKAIFSVSESQKPEKYQRFKSSREVEMRKREEDAAQQKLELEVARKDLHGLFIFSQGMLGAGTGSKRSESKT